MRNLLPSFLFLSAAFQTFKAQPSGASVVNSLPRNATHTVEKELYSYVFKRPFKTELSALSPNCKLVNQTAVNRNSITAKICAFLTCFLKGQASISFGSRELCLESEILFAKFHQGAITQNEIQIAALSLAAILWPLQGFTLENLAVA